MARTHKEPEWLGVDAEVGGESQNLPDDLRKSDELEVDADPFGHEEMGEVQSRTMGWL